MATRNFLLKEDQEEGLKLLLEGVEFPAGVKDARLKFSRWLEDKLVARFKEFGDFDSLKPVLLGSWSRHELTPKSDIDLLFAGPEEKVGEFVKGAFKEGLKLRARTPENPRDWSQGVEPFDVLALYSAKAFAEADRELVDAQRGHALNRKRDIAKAIKREREDRRKRQDSVASYLEPNLKFGAGGLRDIEQALALRALFVKSFENATEYPFKVLSEIKDELLFLRCLLHLNGSGDVLSAHDQIEIARLLKFESPALLMKFLQRELERASFYADWAVAYAQSSGKAKAEAQSELNGASEGIKTLSEGPTLLRQFEVRSRVDEWAKSLDASKRGKLLHQALFKEAGDEFLVALHRTRLLEILIPDFKKLKGLVQHDHYHRFTADAHLVQTLREVERAHPGKRHYGIITKLTREFTAEDWWTLKLTALFHDLAKGRKGDHSTEGARLVEKYFNEWGYSAGLREEVAWLVENHLILSTAAFRQNPQSQSTWQRLFARGVQGKRLLLLAVFTAIDIRATNPEAWTPWKAQLLYNLVQNLNSPEATSLNEHIIYARKKKIPRADEWLMQMDPLLLQMVPPKILCPDLKEAAESGEDLQPRILVHEGRTWLRYHKKSDEPGIFMRFVGRLFGLGLSIQIAAVQTLNGVGVYDWFCLKTDKPPRQIAKWLALKGASLSEPPKVQFQSVSLMSQDEDEWILSFKGRDQRGLLFAAAHALNKQHLSIRWARVHTWGNQVEDVFSVRPLGEVDALLESLNRELVT